MQEEEVMRFKLFIRGEFDLQHDDIEKIIGRCKILKEGGMQLSDIKIKDTLKDKTLDNRKLEHHLK
jgi:hypothetical protein